MSGSRSQVVGCNSFAKTISIQNSGKINCEMEMKITLWLGAGSPQHEELS